MNCPKCNSANVWSYKYFQRSENDSWKRWKWCLDCGEWFLEYMDIKNILYSEMVND